MRNLLQGLACLLLAFSFSSLQAQKPPVKEPDTNRPSLFSQSPQRMNCRITDLESLLELPVGKPVNFHAADNLHIIGTIVSVSSQEDNNMKSVVIRTNNLQGASLTFTRIIKNDGTISFSGRILSFQHADAFELISENGQYAFVKKGFYDLVND
jgi:hypothetical protein